MPVTSDIYGSLLQPQRPEEPMNQLTRILRIKNLRDEFQAGQDAGLGDEPQNKLAAVALLGSAGFLGGGRSGGYGDPFLSLYREVRRRRALDAMNQQQPDGVPGSWNPYDPNRGNQP